MTIDKQALREAAVKATKGPWKAFSDIDTGTYAIHTPRDKRCENVIKWAGFDCQQNAEANAKFIAEFNPKVALALLDDDASLRAENASLRADLGKALWRIEELESRTVTVKLPDISEYLADVHDKTLALAFRRLAEGVREGDVAAMRAAGVKVGG